MAEPSPSRIVILDFGSQYTQVIARRIRECQVFSQILPHDTSAKELAAFRPNGIIFSGSPASVYGKDAPQPGRAVFDLDLPILGICYGVQLMAHHLGGKVEHSSHREYGSGLLHLSGDCPLFHGLPETLDIWNSHGDRITKLPRGFRAVGKTDNSPYAAVEQPKKKFYGLQFHPEVVHTPRGKEILSNFVFQICGAK